MESTSIVPVNINKKVMDYLVKEVPEISEFENDINKNSGEEITHIMRVDIIPNLLSDSKHRDYYLRYIGGNHNTYILRWNNFFVRKDFKEILADNVVMVKL